MSKLITLGSLIDNVVDHYRHHFKELIGISLWLVVGATPFLFSGYMAPIGVDGVTPVSDASLYFIMNLLGFVTTTLASFWVTACLFFTIHARAQGKTPDHVALEKKSWKAVPLLIVLSVLIALAALVAMAVGLLPGLLITYFNRADGTAGTLLGIVGVLVLFVGIFGSLYAIIRYSVEIAFAQPILVLDPAQEKRTFRTLIASIKASRSLVLGSWWNIALRLFIPNAIISLVAFAFAALINLGTTVLVSLASASLSALAIQLIAVFLTLSVFIMNALALPLYNLAVYYLYDSARR